MTTSGPNLPVGVPHECVVVVVERGQSDRSLRRSVLAGAEGRPHDLVVDLRAADSISSEGMSLLRGVQARQRAREQKLMLICAAGSSIEQVLSRTDMRRTFTTSS